MDENCNRTNKVMGLVQRRQGDSNNEKRKYGTDIVEGKD
jgi:hypothetical protein